MLERVRGGISGSEVPSRSRNTFIVAEKIDLAMAQNGCWERSLRDTTLFS